MDLSSILGLLSKVYNKIVGGLKWIGVVLITRKLTQTQAENKQLEASNEIKDQQLEVAARPGDDLDAIRDSMRRSEF